MSDSFPLQSKHSMNPGKAGNFLGCSKDVFHRNAELRGGEEGDPSAFCTRENWQSAVIYLSQAGRQVNSQFHILSFWLTTAIQNHKLEN